MKVPRYVVLTAAAYMPSSCWGRYGKVAVLETNGENMPCRIDERLNCVRRIVRCWDRRNIGKTEKCAFQRAKKEAEELAARLNDQLNVKNAANQQILEICTDRVYKRLSTKR